MKLSLTPKYKLMFQRFFYAWLVAALTWPTFFVNFTKPNWEKPLFITALLVLIPGMIAAILPFTKKRYYIPVTWAAGLAFALLLTTYFEIDVFLLKK